MTDEILARLRAVDWRSKPEPTVASQLIVPVLAALGYGEHTLHKVVEQQSYTLRDPTVSKGSRRIRLDYEPSVYEEGLWVMEAKGTQQQVSSKTLGQVRDYAVHPEVRAALMVTVDAAGFRVFDPWDEAWDEPLVTVSLNEIADRIDELRRVLGVDYVANVVRSRHLDHVRRALSASLEFGVLEDTEREVREILDAARASISAKRLAVHRKAMDEARERHEQVLHQSGAWGVAQHHNDAWAGSVASTRDLTAAVLAQPERQRLTELRQFWPALEAVYRARCATDAELRRPLWWLYVVLMGGCLGLRDKPGCEPDASEMARQAVRDCLLAFPDSPPAAASWRYQRVAIPLICRIGGLAPLDQLSANARKSMSAEDRIRFPMGPEWFFGHSVRRVAIDLLAAVDPWTVEELDRLTSQTAESLGRFPVPSSRWEGPAGDDWLMSWQRVDPLLVCGLAVLRDDERGDDFLQEDAELRDVVLRSAQSEESVLRRVAHPVAERI